MRRAQARWWGWRHRCVVHCLGALIAVLFLGLHVVIADAADQNAHAVLTDVSADTAAALVVSANGLVRSWVPHGQDGSPLVTIHACLPTMRTDDGNAAAAVENDEEHGCAVGLWSHSARLLWYDYVESVAAVCNRTASPALDGGGTVWQAIELPCGKRSHGTCRSFVDMSSALYRAQLHTKTELFLVSTRDGADSVPLTVHWHRNETLQESVARAFARLRVVAPELAREAEHALGPNIAQDVLGSRAAAEDGRKRVKDQLRERQRNGRATRVVIGDMVTASPPNEWISTSENVLDVLDTHVLTSVLQEQNSVDAFMAEHVWEHMTLAEGILAAQNCLQFLKPGGTLRLAVPDPYSFSSWRSEGGTVRQRPTPDEPQAAGSRVRTADSSPSIVASSAAALALASQEARTVLTRLNRKADAVADDPATDGGGGDRDLPQGTTVARNATPETSAVANDLAYDHRVQYTVELLEAMLRAAGFAATERVEYHNSETGEIVTAPASRAEWREEERGAVNRSSVGLSKTRSIIVDAIKHDTDAQQSTHDDWLQSLETSTAQLRDACRLRTHGGEPVAVTKDAAGPYRPNAMYRHARADELAQLVRRSSAMGVVNSHAVEDVADALRQEAGDLPVLSQEREYRGMDHDVLHGASMSALALLAPPESMEPAITTHSLTVAEALLNDGHALSALQLIHSRLLHHPRASSLLIALAAVRRHVHRHRNTGTNNRGGEGSEPTTQTTFAATPLWRQCSTHNSSRWLGPFLWQLQQPEQDERQRNPVQHGSEIAWRLEVAGARDPFATGSVVSRADEAASVVCATPSHTAADSRKSQSHSWRCSNLGQLSRSLQEMWTFPNTRSTRRAEKHSSSAHGSSLHARTNTAGSFRTAWEALLPEVPGVVFLHNRTLQLTALFDNVRPGKRSNGRPNHHDRVLTQACFVLVSESLEFLHTCTSVPRPQLLSLTPGKAIVLASLFGIPDGSPIPNSEQVLLLNVPDDDVVPSSVRNNFSSSSELGAPNGRQRVGSWCTQPDGLPGLHNSTGTFSSSSSSLSPPPAPPPPPPPIRVAFLTIVLNGAGFLDHHMHILEELSQPEQPAPSLPAIEWSWHVVEGVARGRADATDPYSTATIPAKFAHPRTGLSQDNTTQILNEFQLRHPDRVHVHRKCESHTAVAAATDCLWRDKLEMVNHVMFSPQLDEMNTPGFCGENGAADEAAQMLCVLVQLDVDELWTSAMLRSAISMFSEPVYQDQHCAQFDCHFLIGPSVSTQSVPGYGHSYAYEWVRMWRLRGAAEFFLSHAPPVLAALMSTTDSDTADADAIERVAVEVPSAGAHWVYSPVKSCISVNDTAARGLVFSHHAYVSEAQVEHKALFYGYSGAVEGWHRMQTAAARAAAAAATSTSGKAIPSVILGDFLPNAWMKTHEFRQTRAVHASVCSRKAGACMHSHVPVIELPDAGSLMASVPFMGLNPSDTWDSTQLQPTAPCDRTDALRVVVDGIAFQAGPEYFGGIAKVWSNLWPRMLRHAWARNYDALSFPPSQRASSQPPLCFVYLERTGGHTREALERQLPASQKRHVPSRSLPPGEAPGPSAMLVAFLHLLAGGDPALSPDPSIVASGAAKWSCPFRLAKTAATQSTPLFECLSTFVRVRYAPPASTLVDARQVTARTPAANGISAADDSTAAPALMGGSGTTRVASLSFEEGAWAADSARVRQALSTRARVLRRYMRSTVVSDEVMLASVISELNATGFLSTYFSQPHALHSCKRILLVHDVIPEMFGWDLYSVKMHRRPRVIQHADSVVTVSNATKAAVHLAYPGIPAHAVAGASNGYDPTTFRPRTPTEIGIVRRLLEIPEHCGYVLVVGAREGYKNVIPNVLRVMALSGVTHERGRTRPLMFVMVGGPALRPKPERQLLDGQAWRHAEGLSDAQLAAAYSGATALLYLSIAEGFGLPVVEAMACGCPVIMSTAPALLEVAGPMDSNVTSGNARFRVTASVPHVTDMGGDSPANVSAPPPPRPLRERVACAVAVAPDDLFGVWSAVRTMASLTPPDRTECAHLLHTRAEARFRHGWDTLTQHMMDAILV